MGLLLLARAEEPGPARGALHKAQGQDDPRRGAVAVALRHQVALLDPFS